MAVREAVLKALDSYPDGGAVGYLEKLRDDEPKVFGTLIGKCIPRTVDGDVGGDITIHVVTGVPRPGVGEVSDG
jgi:hypothetical protein